MKNKYLHHKKLIIEQIIFWSFGFLLLFIISRYHNNTIVWDEILFIVLLLFITTTLYYKEQEKRIEIEKRYNRFNLSPHFLFNQINFIYNDIYLINKQIASKIIKFSNLLSYHIEKSEEKEVTLWEEISFINNFIELENSHLKEAPHVEFTYPEEEQCQIKVVPLLFEEYINNAYKNVKNDGTGYINISININKDLIKFICKNNYYQHVIRSTHKGIELSAQNISDYYPYKNTITTQTDGDCYLVEIVLKI